MNFLSICQMAARESRVIPVEPTTVVGATGKMRKLVMGVNDVYRDLQIERDDWFWMHKEFTAKPLQINVSRYTAASFSLARFSSWGNDRRAPNATDSNYLPFTIYDSAIGVADQVGIEEITYQEWRILFDRGAQTANRPTKYAISPVYEFCVGPVPDKTTYLLGGEYGASPQDLTVDANVPELPDAFHQYLAWAAITRLREGDEAPPQVIAAAINNAARIKGAIIRSQTEGLVIGGGPIA